MIGERLLELRKDANLTQDDLAAILNINKHSISSYERDKSEPPDAIKVAIAKYFNVSLDYLAGLTDFPRPLDVGERTLRLPDGLMEEYMPDLMDYIDYLIYKGRRK